MKVRMKTVARGPKLNADAGDVIEVADRLGRQLCAQGHAEPVGAEVETATEAAAETAEAPKPKRKRAPRKKAAKKKRG